MKPIGLILKNIKHNPFTGRTSGELMIIHLCLNCGRISYNRIAGDDNSYTIISLLAVPDKLNTGTINKFTSLEIKLLTQTDKHQVLVALFGYGYKDYMK